VYFHHGEIQPRAVLYPFVGECRSLRFNCDEAVL
jgi:hypothetical protein